MSTIDDATLLAYHCGALEPGDARDVEVALAADPALGLRLRDAANRLIEPPPTDPYRIPPPGLGMSGFGLQGTAGLVLAGDEAIRPGDRFRVTLHPDDAGRRRVVVLYRRRDAWEVVFPTRPEEAVTAEALPRDDDGARLLDLAARADRGRQRWAVALPSTDLAIDWAVPGDARWATLQDGIAGGTVPVASVEIEVR
jgi:hypothetical protein